MIPRKLFLIILAIFYQIRKSLFSYSYPWGFSAKDLGFTMTKTKDIALSSFRTFSNNLSQHLSKGKFDALKNKQTISKQTNRHSKIWQK